MPDPTISDFMTRMAAAFDPARAAGLDAVIQARLTGAEAEDWIVAIRDGQCAITPGAAPSPRLTVTCDSGNFMKIFTGQLDGMQAFMQGKLRVSGDMGLALKLLNLFKVR
jgi:putative sterol carrier protein